MLPILHVGAVAVSSFSAMMLLAFLVAAMIGMRQARFVGISPTVVWQLLPWGAAAGVIGSKLYAVLWNFPSVMRNGVHWSTIGEVWYGGLICGVAASAWRWRALGYPMHWLFDYGAAPVAFGHAIGRVGCFLVGDDYGVPTSGPLGVVFPFSSPPTTAASLRAQGAHVAASIPADQVMAVYPTQLFEAIVLVCIGTWLLRQSRRPHRTWGVFAQYSALYGAWRFCVEFLRVKDDRLAIGLTSAQVISVLLVVTAVYVWQRRTPLEPAPPMLGAAG